MLKHRAGTENVFATIWSKSLDMCMHSDIQYVETVQPQLMIISCLHVRGRIFFACLPALNVGEIKSSQNKEIIKVFTLAACSHHLCHSYPLLRLLALCKSAVPFLYLLSSKCQPKQWDYFWIFNTQIHLSGVTHRNKYLLYVKHERVAVEAAFPKSWNG